MKYTQKSFIFAIATFACWAVSILLISPTNASGQCEQWDVSGAWSLTQSDYITVKMNLRQNDKNLAGTAEYTTDVRGEAKTFFGTVDGEARNNNFVVRISWDNIGNQVGVYSAKFDAQGRLNGTIYIEKDSGGRNRDVATWSSVSTMKCAPTVITAPTQGSPPAAPQCPQWNVSGPWSLKQSDHITVQMDLRQNGTRLTGTAEYSVDVGGQTKTYFGTVQGEARNNNFSARISWNNPGKQIGLYNAKFDPQGRLNGTIHLESGGGGRSRDLGTWSSVGEMRKSSGCQ